MTSVKEVFKDEFNENIKNNYNFMIINKNDTSYIRIINNVDLFNVVFMQHFKWFHKIKEMQTL